MAPKSRPDTSPAPERACLGRKKRVVVKIGSALLARAGSRVFAQLAAEIGRARAAHGCELVLVSSGAIALGLHVLGLRRRPTRLDMQQAAAAAGQPELMQRWAKALRRHQVPVAQVLLTHADLAHRERFLNARHALSALLSRGVLPIINENDSVATDEIRVGDNDNLSAHVANLVAADLLIILTTVDGIYDTDPEQNAAARRIPVVRSARAVAAFAGDAGGSGLGVGGMRTKIEAAHAAVKRSVPVVIARGDAPRVLTRILHGDDVGTLFLPEAALPSRKHWIGFTLRPHGRLRIDAGAERALRHAGRSLLASGLVAAEGEFERGAMVDIIGPTGELVGRGLTAYGSRELQRLCGVKSGDIVKILGYVDTPEVIHRDDLTVV